MPSGMVGKATQQMYLVLAMSSKLSLGQQLLKVNKTLQSSSVVYPLGKSVLGYHTRNKKLNVVLEGIYMWRYPADLQATWSPLIL